MIHFRFISLRVLLPPSLFTCFTPSLSSYQFSVAVNTELHQIALGLIFHFLFIGLENFRYPLNYQMQAKTKRLGQLSEAANLCLLLDSHCSFVICNFALTGPCDCLMFGLMECTQSKSVLCGYLAWWGQTCWHSFSYATGKLLLIICYLFRLFKGLRRGGDVQTSTVSGGGEGGTSGDAYGYFLLFFPFFVYQVLWLVFTVKVCVDHAGHFLLLEQWKELIFWR